MNYEENKDISIGKIREYLKTEEKFFDVRELLVRRAFKNLCEYIESDDYIVSCIGCDMSSDIKKYVVAGELDKTPYPCNFKVVDDGEAISFAFPYEITLKSGRKVGYKKDLVDFMRRAMEDYRDARKLKVYNITSINFIKKGIVRVIYRVDHIVSLTFDFAILHKSAVEEIMKQPEPPEFTVLNGNFENAESNAV